MFAGFHAPETAAKSQTTNVWHLMSDARAAQAILDLAARGRLIECLASSIGPAASDEED